MSNNKLKQKIRQEVKKLFDDRLTPALSQKKAALQEIAARRQKLVREVESFQHKIQLAEEQTDKLQAEIDEAIVSGKAPDLQKIAVRRAELDTFRRQLTRLDAQDKEEIAKEEKAASEVKETIKAAMSALHGDILGKVEALLREVVLTMCVFEDMGLEFCKEHGIEDKETVRSFSLFTDIAPEIQKSLDPFTKAYEDVHSVILRRETRERLLFN